MTDTDRYKISTTLLHDCPEAWSNLGLWITSDQSYVAAATALADRHWQLAKPAAGARMLDAGCGYGASLHYWKSLDSTLKLTALECQPHCLARLNKEGWLTINGRFDDLRLPVGLSPASQDAVMCIDAAYHASSLLRFAQFSSKVLRPGGVLVFSTLIVSPRVSATTRLMLRAAGVPLASQLSRETLEEALNEAGLRLVDVIDLDADGEGVLKGFANYAPRRARALNFAQRMSTDWFKIAMTGRLCNKLSTEAGVRYVLIRAQPTELNASACRTPP